MLTAGGDRAEHVPLHDAAVHLHLAGRRHHHLSQPAGPGRAQGGAVTSATS